ncbi:guanine nucleotide binding protein, alpha subunit, partial [Mycena olivaceomarginata]
FVEERQRLAQNGYVPAEEDTLRTAAQTQSTARTEIRVNMSEITLRIVDLGDQQSEWNERIHSLESVTNVIFCMPLNNYDELRANSRAPTYLPFRLLPPLIRSPIPAQYCMRGSLALFESIIRPSLARTSNDLFFTKIDVFRDKLTAIGWE